MRGAQAAYRFLRNLESSVGANLKLHVVKSGTMKPQHVLLVVNGKDEADLLRQKSLDRMFNRMSQVNVVSGMVELLIKGYRLFIPAPEPAVVEEHKVTPEMLVAVNHKLNNIEALLLGKASQEPMPKKPNAGSAGAGIAPKQGNGKTADGGTGPNEGNGNQGGQNQGNGAAGGNGEKQGNSGIALEGGNGGSDDDDEDDEEGTDW